MRILLYSLALPRRRNLNPAPAGLKPILPGLVMLLLSAVLSCAAAETNRVAAFRADFTPPAGEPLIWTTPTTKHLDKLEARGIVIESAGKRYVLCAIDWCGLANRTHRELRRKIAQAAGTDESLVALQTLHQHTAPYVDEDAYELLREIGNPVREFSRKALTLLTDRTAGAVRDAVKQLQPFDRLGTGQAKVEGVASARRLTGPDGKVLTRFSTGGRDPALAAAPEGPIDPLIRTVSFANGGKVIARLHYYATHPQTWCCDGVASADAIGTARSAFEAEDGAVQIYFTGCSGDVTVGKYNDGSEKARSELAKRWQDGMKRAAAATHWEEPGGTSWSSTPLPLPKRLKTAGEADRLLASLRNEPNDVTRYRAAMNIVFARKQQPLEATMLTLGSARILHLPGEPMIEFQRFAQAQRPGGFVAVAGYGDISPGYICTDDAYRQGGYEPSASFTAPGAEAVMKQAIRKLLTR